MKPKNIYLAYGLALILWPVGAHRRYMLRADWWLMPVVFGIGFLASLSSLRPLASAMTATLMLMFLWDLVTMWQWDRNLTGSKPF
jgi:hypothetical protein